MFISVANNKIIGTDIMGYSEGGIDYPITNVEVSEEVYNAYIADNDRYIYSDGEIIENPNYEEIKRQKEEERVGGLTMTALDFITFLRQCGLTLEQIRAYLDNNIELDTQLKYCQNVYCRVAKAIMPITLGNITITPEMVEQAFKYKNGELPD